MSILESVLFGARQDERCGLLKLRRRRHPVQTRQAAQVFIGRHSAGFIAYPGPLRGGQKWSLGIKLKANSHNPAEGGGKPKTLSSMERLHMRMFALRSVQPILS